MKLPQPQDDEEFDAIDRGAAVFILTVRSLFESFMESNTEIRLFENGSSPTFSVGQKLVAKFFAPIHREHFYVELASLGFLEVNQFLAPRIVSRKNLAGWNVILMTRLEGQPLKEIWSELSFGSKKIMSVDIGKKLKQLHSFSDPVLPNNGISWSKFIENQKRGCVERQARFKLSENLIREIPGFLESIDFAKKKEVFLHTEIMVDHVLASNTENTLEISVFIDFEPAMIGAYEYDFASVGLFVAAGELGLFKAFIEGYGYQPDPEFHRRVMAYALLHRYSNLSWYLEFMPQASSLNELAEKWFRV